MHNTSHLSDEQLLSWLDGEILPGERGRMASHLDECWRCRARKEELATAINGFMDAYSAQQLPSATGPRALLKARLEQLAAGPGPSFSAVAFARRLPWAFAAAAFAAVVAGCFLYLGSTRPQTQPRSAVISVPKPSITPGAALLASRPAICAGSLENNKVVPATMRRRVLEEYGLGGADPRMYEIDYLVTPALGGADDIHNLWPHSYSATIWNARVKDALESRLRKRVCEGSLDLATAQREIAGNWISAYKKYFGTDTPLPEHLQR